jgi:hypothetical protein
VYIRVVARMLEVFATNKAERGVRLADPLFGLSRLPGVCKQARYAN